MNKRTINELFLHHPLAEAARRPKSEQIRAALGSFVSSVVVASEWQYALSRIVTSEQLKRCRKETIAEALALFRAEPVLTLDTMEQLGDDLSRAVFALIRPGRSHQMESVDRISVDEPREIEDFENVWHPEYARFCEHVYGHIMKLPLGIVGTKKSKDYVSQSLANRVSTLEAAGFKHLVLGYDSVVRNSISHGRVRYGQGDITYIDSKTTKTYFPTDAVLLLDDLVDTCSGLAVAMLLFLCEHKAHVTNWGMAKLPLALRFLLADGYASHFGASLVGVVESVVMGGKRQLNISVQISTTAKSAQQFEGLHLAWAAVAFGCLDYQRIFMSVDCGKPIQSLLILHGDKLTNAIVNDAPISECIGSLFESALLWYDGRSLRDRLYAWRISLSTNWQIFRRNMRGLWKETSSRTGVPSYRVVAIRNNSASSVRRVELSVIVDETGIIAERDFLRVVSAAKWFGLRRLIRAKDIHGDRGLPWFPECVLMRFYSEDHRLRKLRNYSITSTTLLAIGEWAKNWRKSPPFYTRDKFCSRIHDGTRVRYNQNVASAASLLTNAAKGPGSG